MPSELTLDELRRRSGNSPIPKTFEVDITFVKPLDAIVLLRDLSAQTDSRDPYGNIKIAENADPKFLYRQANTAMVSYVLAAPEFAILNLADNVTEAIEAMKSTEGLESLIMTLGSRMLQLEQYEEIDFSSFARAISKVSLNGTFAGGHELGSLIFREDDLTSAAYYQFKQQAFMDFSGGDESLMRQVLANKMGELGSFSISDRRSQKISDCRALSGSIGGIIGAIAGSIAGSPIPGAGTAVGFVKGLTGGAAIGTGLGEVFCPVIIRVPKSDTNDSDDNDDNDDLDVPTIPAPAEKDSEIGCIANPDDFNSTSPGLLFSWSKTDIRAKMLKVSALTGYIKADNLKVSISSLPSINTKYKERFKASDLKAGYLTEDSQYLGRLKVYSKAFEMRINRPSRINGSTNRYEDLLIPSNLNIAIEPQYYGIGVEYGIQKIPDSDSDELGIDENKVEEVATFSFSSPALEHILGVGGATIIGKANIEAFLDQVKFASALASVMDQNTTFVRNE